MSRLHFRRNFRRAGSVRSAGAHSATGSARWSGRRLRVEPLEDRRLLAVTLTWAGAGKPFSLTEGTSGATPAIVISEPSPNINLLRIDLGAGNYFASDSTAAATGLAYEIAGSPTISQFATIDISLANNVSALQATLADDNVTLGPIRNLAGGISSVTVSAADIDVKGINTAAVNGNVGLNASGDLTIDSGAVVQTGTGTISLAAGSAGVLTIGSGATVVSANSTVNAITLRGGDIDIDASANPAVIGAQRVMDTASSVATLTGVNAPQALAFDGIGRLYVANANSNTVSIFTPGSTTPSATLTGVSVPKALAFDARGNLYVANSGGTTVSVFMPGSTTPDATLTGLSSPQALAFDVSGNLYVANAISNTVSKFIPGSTTPSATLTGLSIPSSLAFDGSGNLYVANWGGTTVSKFAPGGTTPSATLTGLTFPRALVFDSSGNLYVANSNSNSVTKFASGGATANATLTGVSAPQSLAFDASGNLYVANAGTNAVAKFGAGSTSPSATLTAGRSPLALAFDGSGNLYVANHGTNTVSRFTPVSLTPIAGGVVIRSSTSGRPMSLGGTNSAVPGINLTDDELASIRTTPTGKVTVGDTSQAGDITFTTAKAAATAGASTLVVQSISGAGSIRLDDAGPGIGLDGNGGKVFLTSGKGNVVAPLATGGVTLASNEFTAAGLTLTPTLSFAPDPDTKFTVINNQAAASNPWNNPIISPFVNLPQGGTISVNFGETSYYFEADYAGGDGNDLVLSKQSYTTKLTAAPNRSVFGETVTFTLAADGPLVGKGTVNFKNEDGAVLASAEPIDSNGQASFPISSLAVGSHTITAEYSGAEDFYAKSSQSVIYVVDPPMHNTTTVLMANPQPAVYGQAVFCTATVESAGLPLSDGTVDFEIDGAMVEPAVPVNAFGQASSWALHLSVGPHSITAHYNGAVGYAPSSRSIDLMVNPSDTSVTPGLFDPASSHFHLRSTNNPSDNSEKEFGFGQAGAGWQPFVGDWNGDGAAGVGLYDPKTSTFYLANQTTTGSAEFTFGYGAPDGGWIPLVGDWNGDGKMGVGLYDPINSVFYLTNNFSTGIAQYAFGYGAPSASWVPLVGDWNGDGVAGVGLYDPHRSTFYLTNTLATGIAEHTFGYGKPEGGWTPFVGDWNGDGAAGVGLYDPQMSNFHLTDQPMSGAAEYEFGYGMPGGVWTPLVGDWDGNRSSGVGLYDPSASKFYLTNTLTTGTAEIEIQYGQTDGGWLPLTGCWPQGGAALRAEDAALPGTAAGAIEANDLKPIIEEAIAGWAAAGISEQALNAMRQADFMVTDLPGTKVGLAVGRSVTIDGNAAGHGWFVDPTPGTDEEFARLRENGQLRAVDPRAVDRLDLLTVVEHELGHVAGLEDLDPAIENLMSGTLGVGVRREG